MAGRILGKLVLSRRGRERTGHDGRRETVEPKHMDLGMTPNMQSMGRKLFFK